VEKIKKVKYRGNNFMELKTLKDLRELGLKKYNRIPYDYWIKERKIKAEAVKWIKTIEKDKTIGVRLFNDGKKHRAIGKAIYGDVERKIINQEKIDFLMDFFNLTEEDLK
jgi:hypothetical protein